MAKRKAKTIKYGSANGKKMPEKKNYVKPIRITFAIISIICILVSVVAMISVIYGSTKEYKIYTAEMKVKDFGTMKLELYEYLAPISVNTFVDYVNDGFYDGLTFHRIMKDFMIQGGDPAGTGSGSGNLPTIDGEFKDNGWSRNYSLKFTKGVIGMARGDDPDSATSQFFICLDKYNYGNGKYASFGKVVEGIDVLEEIGNVDVYANSKGEMSLPVEKVYIDTVEITGSRIDDSYDPYMKIYTLVIPFAAVAIALSVAYVLIKKKYSK